MTQDILDQYLRDALMARPRLWDCGRFGLGIIERIAPHVGRDILGRWPKYDTRLEAAAEFERREIHDAMDYCLAVAEFSNGTLEVVDRAYAKPGDLCFLDKYQIVNRPFPAMGILGHDGQSHFLGAFGGMKTVPSAETIDNHLRLA